MYALPHIALSIPWRDRAWVAPAVLRAIEAQDYPAELLGIRFLAHNCTDGTQDILREWLREVRRAGRYRYASLMVHADDSPVPERTPFCYDRGPRDPRHAMAALKNLLATPLQEDEWFLYLDSDIILAPDCIRRIAEAKADVVGGLTNVTPRGHAWTAWNFFPMPQPPSGPFSRDGAVLPGRMAQVGFVSGLFLLSPRALAVATPWSFEGVGEDEPSMRRLTAAGIPIWLEPAARGEHIMRPCDLEPAVRDWEAYTKGHDDRP